jgi:DNA polymerase III alpha subunit (gram-positive type)
MLAYLVNDDDFKVPHEMTNLTGITQEILRKYGKKTDVVDKELSQYYQGKKVLFGAHNTPYDARVLRANTKQLYEVLKENRVYDSALFARQEKLAYDDIKVSSFENVDGMPKIFFYNNEHSDFNLTKFIEKNENGYYPYRKNNYLL